jgi:hypothetical protein
VEALKSLDNPYQQKQRNCLVQEVVSNNWSHLKQVNPPITRVPEFVKNELEAFLRCGVFAHGFIRLYCSAFHSSELLAFSYITGLLDVEKNASDIGNDKAYIFDYIDAAITNIQLAAQAGDTVLIMSNGGFQGIYKKLLEVLC